MSVYVSHLVAVLNKRNAGIMLANYGGYKLVKVEAERF